MKQEEDKRKIETYGMLTQSIVYNRHSLAQHCPLGSAIEVEELILHLSAVIYQMGIVAIHNDDAEWDNMQNFLDNVLKDLDNFKEACKKMAFAKKEAH